MPFFVIVLLVFLLISSAVSYLVNRRVRHQSPWKRGLKVAMALGGSFALCGVLLVVSVFALLLEPWPLSRRQGPDTAYAVACFKRHLQPAQPLDIRHLYCREEWGFGGDSIYSIHFTFGSRTTPRDLAAALGLRRMSAERRERVRYLAGPKWWPLEAEMRRLEEVYGRDETDFLWVDPHSKQAYFQRARF